MAIRRRLDGIGEDGSYSVAADFDKQIGQALAEQEARLKDPRFVPGALVERPDSPDILQRELIDPVLTAFGMNTPSRRGVAPESAARSPFEFRKTKDGRVLRTDKMTGNTDVVFDDVAIDEQPDLVPRTASQIANWFQNSPVMRAEESEALSKLNQPGADPVDILGVQHPTLLKNPPYANRFGPIFREAQRRRSRDENAPIETVTPDVAALATERGRLSSQLTGDLPGNVSGAISNRIADIDSSITPSPTGDNEELISVINPRGKHVRIRKSQLDAALKAKYKLR